jgi:hypothetical protein
MLFDEEATLHPHQDHETPETPHTEPKPTIEPHRLLHLIRPCLLVRPPAADLRPGSTRCPPKPNARACSSAGGGCAIGWACRSPPPRPDAHARSARGGCARRWA